MRKPNREEVIKTEETTWKKDETPYLIFQCAKCKQYLYTKTTQKGKKCLRCGRNHTVSIILNSGEIVNGMSAAVEMVKKRQNELGKKELGHSPELRAFGDFTVAVKKSEDRIRDGDGSSEDTIRQFEKMLKEIYSTYKKFPLYIIEIIADNYGIPASELEVLTRSFQKKGILIRLNDNSYTVKI
ncbi:MAG: DUF1922 domain-containing protein [Candidatus Hodarchaeota archaeon]